MTPVIVIEGKGPVILGQPHSGVFVPDAIKARLNERGRMLADTDWHVDRLYDGLLSGASLYPGQNTTGLVPLTDFDGEAIWNQAPEPKETERRRIEFHAAYHLALAAEIDRARDAHGVAVLYDCHSIRSHIPYLFDGRLPDLNIGTNNGATCASALEAAVADACAESQFTYVVNGRFRGGWTTRHYGQPQEGVHAIQMEIAQSAYLETEDAPFSYSETKAAKLRGVLKTILERAEEIALSGKLNGAE